MTRMSALGDHPPADDWCPCGAQLLRGSSSVYGMTQQIALCSSSKCGRVASSPSEDDPLKTFLIGQGSPHPDAPPWLRTFLAASRIPGTGGWQVAPEACWSCEEPHLTVEFSFRPLFRPESVVLCLACGDVEATFRTDGGL